MVDGAVVLVMLAERARRILFLQQGPVLTHLSAILGPMTPQTQPVTGGSAHALCLSLVVETLRTTPALVSCLQIVAERGRDDKRRARYRWRRKAI